MTAAEEVPGEMTMFAVGFVFDNTENDAQMQEKRRRKKFARHLRIIDDE